jgi:hypothetical protein
LKRLFSFLLHILFVAFSRKYASLLLKENLLRGRAAKAVANCVVNGSCL